MEPFDANRVCDLDYYECFNPEGWGSMEGCTEGICRCKAGYSHIHSGDNMCSTRVTGKFWLTQQEVKLLEHVNNLL